MSTTATTPPESSEPWTREEFESQLRARGATFHDLHPFHQRMNDGELSRDELQRWVVNRYLYQASIPLKDANILANCPEPDVRRTWISRIVDHDGTTPANGGLESWLRLGEALGVDREDLVSERRALPGVRYAVDAYVNFCRNQPWIVGVASSLTELFNPRVLRTRFAALIEHYPWIDPAGLEYFRTRLSLVPVDADHALNLVLDRCVTRADQQRAVDALAFKCDLLWAQLDAIDAGDTRPAAAAQGRESLNHTVTA